ncbi:uncharacterized protein [Anabrus simplex]
MDGDGKGEKSKSRIRMLKEDGEDSRQKHEHRTRKEKRKREKDKTKMEKHIKVQHRMSIATSQERSACSRLTPGEEEEGKDKLVHSKFDREGMHTSGDVNSLFGNERLVKRELTPELARISALTEGPPKAKCECKRSWFAGTTTCPHSSRTPATSSYSRSNPPHLERADLSTSSRRKPSNPPSLERADVSKLKAALKAYCDERRPREEDELEPPVLEPLDPVAQYYAQKSRSDQSDDGDPQCGSQRLGNPERAPELARISALGKGSPRCKCGCKKKCFVGRTSSYQSTAPSSAGNNSAYPSLQAKPPLLERADISSSPILELYNSLPSDEEYVSKMKEVLKAYCDARKPKEFELQPPVLEDLDAVSHYYAQKKRSNRRDDGESPHGSERLGNPELTAELPRISALREGSGRFKGDFKKSCVAGKASSYQSPALSSAASNSPHSSLEASPPLLERADVSPSSYIEQYNPPSSNKEDYSTEKGVLKGRCGSRKQRDAELEPPVLEALDPVAFYYDSDGNKVWICPTCGGQDDGSPMIGCDECDAWYHWVCVGMNVAPDEKEDWYCRHCVAKRKERMRGRTNFQKRKKSS